jgi:geranylgeranyl pyrophosphate synthase
MKPKTRRTRSEALLKILKTTAADDLNLAKNAMRKEKIESPKIREALRYYTSRWEIFVHPAFFSLSCQAVSDKQNITVKGGAAVAMFAAAFDLHDDVVDESRVKHGRLTVFGQFGHDAALLLGNAFFVEGFKLLGETAVELPKAKACDVFETVGRLMFELGSAHALELEMKGRIDVDPDDYLRVLKMKAASIEADTRLGALMGLGTNQQIEALAKYGRIMGTLATLREEFIDLYDAQELRQRIEKECPPLPLLYALRRDGSGEIRRTLQKKKLTDKDAGRLLDTVYGTEELRGLKGLMNGLVGEAVALTSAVRKRETRSLLIELAGASLDDL